MAKTTKIFGREYSITQYKRTKIWSVIDIETTEMVASGSTRELAMVFLGMHLQSQILNPAK